MTKMTGGHRRWKRVKALGAAQSCCNGIWRAWQGLAARYLGQQMFREEEQTSSEGPADEVEDFNIYTFPFTALRSVWCNCELFCIPKNACGEPLGRHTALPCH